MRKVTKMCLDPAPQARVRAIQGKGGDSDTQSTKTLGGCGALGSSRTSRVRLTEVTLRAGIFDRKGGSDCGRARGSRTLFWWCGGWCGQRFEGNVCHSKTQNGGWKQPRKKQIRKLNLVSLHKQKKNPSPHPTKKITPRLNHAEIVSFRKAE